MKPTSKDRRATRVSWLLAACFWGVACTPEVEEIPLNDGSSMLGGTSWSVREYADGLDGMVSIEDGSIHATFTVDGRVAGNAGCNDYLGNFATDGAHITIRADAVTDTVCGAARMERESAFMAALRDAATWEIDGTELALRTRDGSPLLVCSARRLPALPEPSKPAPLGTR